MSIKGRQVIVTDGNVEKALRKFKKKILEQGLLQEIRDRSEFVKPTIQRKIDKGLAKRRWQKYLRDQSLPKKLF
ncbi:MAG: 30S ribosomal protein S21 [Candidatus Nanopelagicus sp.]